MKMIKGMDISTLLGEEACGAKYYDFGEEADLLDILKRYGVNSVRLRLWNDPYDEQGNPYGAGTNDLEWDFCWIITTVISGQIRVSRLCRRHGRDTDRSSWRRQCTNIRSVQ